MSELPKDAYALDSTLGLLDLRREYDENGFAAYALTRIYSPEQRDVPLSLRADGPCAVWLNGQLAHTDGVEQGRSVGDTAQQLVAKLQRGWNVLAIKVISPTDKDRCVLSLEETPDSSPE